MLWWCAQASGREGKNNVADIIMVSWIGIVQNICIGGWKINTTTGPIMKNSRIVGDFKGLIVVSCLLLKI